MSGWPTSARPARQSAFRPSSIFVGLVAVFITGAVLAWYNIGNANVDIIVFVVTGWLVSLSLHEYAHALYAYLRGDRSTAERGYLTLNLLKYTHPILSIVLPVAFLLIGGIGLPGGAVWIDRHALRGGKVVQSLVSLVGPLTNVVFAIVVAIPFWFLTFGGYFAHVTFWAGLAFLGFLQVTAAVINLAPIPGTDGGNALRPWLPPNWQRGFDYVAPYGLLLLFALLFQPTVNAIFFSFVDWICSLLGLPPFVIGTGQRLFQFWR